MNDLRIQFSSNALTLSQIINEQFDHSQFSDFENSIIELIKNWESGQEEFIITTSGSTGKPKKLSFNRHQIITSVNMTQKALGLEKDMTALICLHPRYVAGMMMVFRCLILKMNMILSEPSSNPIKNLLPLTSIQLASFVPLQVDAIISDPNTSNSFNNIKMVLIGGAPLNGYLDEKLSGFKNKIYATYGMTETLTHIALRRINGSSKKKHFQALQGVSLKTDNQHCLIINTPVLDDEIKTNDIVELDQEKKSFIWKGRADFVINSGGIKIHPEELEDQIGKLFYKLGFQRRVMVTGLADKKLGHKIVLLIEGQKPAIHEEIEYALHNSLDKYSIPKEVYYLPHFREAGNNKIDRIKTTDLVEEVRNNRQ